MWNGLKFLHGIPCLHCDLKPGNILLTEHQAEDAPVTAKGCLKCLLSIGDAAFPLSTL